MSIPPQETTEFVKPLFKKSRRKWLYGGAALIVVLGVGIPVTMAKLKTNTTISPGQLYTVGDGTVTQDVSTSGTIQAPTELDLDFQGSHSGLLTNISVKIGQKVKAGQVLGKIDDSNEKIQVSQAEAGLKQANASLSAANAKLAQDQQGTTSAQIATDNLAVQKAQTALNQAKQQYQDQLATYNDRTSAEAQVQSAQNALTQAQEALNSTDGSLASDQQKLATDQATLQQDEQALANAKAQYGDVTEQQVQDAYQNYETALSRQNGWANGGYTGSNPYSSQVSTAQSEYNDLNTAYTAVQNAQSVVTKDQQTVATDQTNLANDQSTESQSQQKAQEAYNEAKQNLQLAQQQYNDRTSAKQSLDNANNAVTNAQQALQSAQLTLKNDEQPATQATIASDESQVASAQASVQNAEANLQSAQLAEDETTLKAPIDGIITAINGQVGEQPGQASSSSSSSSSGSGSSSNSFIVMNDSNANDLQVNLQVSESQIGSVKPGDPITVTVPAYPNQTFKGTITQVYPMPQTVSNVTQYTVMATVDNSSGNLKPGMSASVSIQTAQKSNVVTVPAIALHQMGSMEGVYVYGGSAATGSGKAGRSVSGTSGNQAASGWSGRAGGSNSTGGHAWSGGSGSGFGGSGSSFGGAGTSGSRSSSGGTSSKSKSNLPAGVHFQPVQVGLMGSNSVEITGGLQTGEKILLVLPGQTASAIVSQSSSGGFGFGGAGGRSFAGGGGGGSRSGGKG